MVLAFDTANALVLVAAVAAQVVVALAVIDVGERDVARNVALVLAVEARQGECLVEFAKLDLGRLRRRERGEVGAGRGAWLVRAIGAVAVVIVEASNIELDTRIRDASECLSVFVELGDCGPRLVAGRVVARACVSRTYTLGLHREGGEGPRPHWP